MLVCAEVELGQVPRACRPSAERRPGPAEEGAMLPKLDGRVRGALPLDGERRGRALNEEKVVALPRLRLLKQVSPPSLLGDEEQYRPRRRPLSRGELAPAEKDPGTRPGSGGSGQPGRRGRGILRPLHADGKPPMPRSPPQLPVQGRPPRLESVDVASSQDLRPASFCPADVQERARERVRERRKQRRRHVREEDERKLQEEQERMERAQQQQSHVDSHRHQLAKAAAEQERRRKETKAAASKEREELELARRGRVRQYRTPDAINELVSRVEVSANSRRPASRGPAAHRSKSPAPPTTTPPRGRATAASAEDGAEAHAAAAVEAAERERLAAAACGEAAASPRAADAAAAASLRDGPVPRSGSSTEGGVALASPAAADSAAEASLAAVAVVASSQTTSVADAAVQEYCMRSIGRSMGKAEARLKARS